MISEKLSVCLFVFPGALGDAPAGAALALEVVFAHLLADDAGRQHLHAAHEADVRRHGRPAGDGPVRGVENDVQAMSTRLASASNKEQLSFIYSALYPFLQRAISLFCIVV